jgi:ABC-type cobalamin/Fe3+-siderophores transport system ATPase subunit
MLPDVTPTQWLRQSPATFCFVWDLMKRKHSGWALFRIHWRKKVQSEVKLPNGDKVLGSGPIVIIGPNGVGKTRLGVAITQANNAERVAALRHVEVPEIPMQRFEHASRQVQSAIQQVMNEHWRQSYELQNLLSEIVAEYRESAVQHLEYLELNPSTKPDEKLTNTRLRKLVKIWNQHFPGRQIEINYEPKVERSINGNTVSYSIAQMSEGERTALYLTARVISCLKPILIVDEPEVFFHPLLARNLWNSLEESAPNIRFVYITHDIPFALSRRGAQFAIARSESTAELLPPTSGIPSDVVAQVLGAASFSVSASRLIFCEGLPDSYDNSILTAWHNCPKTAVVPVGGCEAVRECVSVFRAGKFTTGVTACGYIDRDGWPDNHLDSDPYIKAHPVSEIEGYLCLEPVFRALGIYSGLSEPELTARYNTFLSGAKSHFKNVVLNKEILNRAKKRVEMEQKALLNPIKPDDDIGKLRTIFEAATPSGGWNNYLATVFAEEEKRLVASHRGTPEDFIKDFPAKSYFSQAAAQLNQMPDAVIRTICLALQLSDNKAVEDNRLKALRDALVSAMSPYMWPRMI